MVKYTCQICLKDFKQKSHFDKHHLKKNPCNNNIKKIENLIIDIVDNKLNSLLDIDNNILEKIELNIFNNNKNTIKSTINMENNKDLSKLLNLDLIIKCKELGIVGCSRKNKSELI